MHSGVPNWGLVARGNSVCKGEKEILVQSTGPELDIRSDFLLTEFTATLPNAKVTGCSTQDPVPVPVNVMGTDVAAKPGPGV